jgi:hypothetical protein
MARGLDTNGKALCRMMTRRTDANLVHGRKKHGLIRSMPGPSIIAIGNLMLTLGLTALTLGPLIEQRL